MGSSPLTRGKPFTTWVSGTASGLIPAHAGKTAPNGIKNFADGAHPRSRGENRLIHWPPRTLVGSSPLTRGKHHRRDHAGRGPGLIPAHAGKTWWGRSSLACSRAHPRSRGENERRVKMSAATLGSSPLTRGKPLTRPLSPARQGLIPAHAGKTCSRRRRGWSRGAHPRSRGENWVWACPTRWTRGSSPLTRGKQERERVQPLADGLIPAHTEKTRPATCRALDIRAHPRSRRENTPRLIFSIHP